MYFESGGGHNKITDLYANITVNELKVKKFKKRQSDFFRKITKILRFLVKADMLSPM